MLVDLQCLQSERKLTGVRYVEDVTAVQHIAHLRAQQECVARVGPLCLVDGTLP